jgi:hypothetical protein
MQEKLGNLIYSELKVFFLAPFSKKLFPASMSETFLRLVTNLVSLITLQQL